MKLTGSTFDQRVLCFKPLSSGQLGEVYEVNGDRVAVILDIAKDIEHDPDTEMEYCYIATEVL
ncbi:hypothetical protein OIU84_027334, partial [Salix udensis]